MREILFRGKRKDNGEWVYGTPIFYSSGTTVMCNEYQRNENIDLKTVGQYTGLKDKNGKRIFEGDIVLKRTHNGKKPMPVYFDGGQFTCGVGGGSSTPSHYYSLEDKQIEVIGNIHDNPELLEGATSNEAINPAKI